jgi:hypothetical protein
MPQFLCVFLLSLPCSQSFSRWLKFAAPAILASTTASRSPIASKHVDKVCQRNCDECRGCPHGVTFLNFCRDSRICPFTVVVLSADLKKVGDIRLLEGREVEIKGTIEDYEGRAQMVLRHTQQLGESAFVVVPPVPTDCDVERRGYYSAGRYSHPKAKKAHKKQGRPISIEDPEEPQQGCLKRGGFKQPFFIGLPA